MIIIRDVFITQPPINQFCPVVASCYCFKQVNWIHWSTMSWIVKSLLLISISLHLDMEKIIPILYSDFIFGKIGNIIIIGTGTFSAPVRPLPYLVMSWLLINQSRPCCTVVSIGWWEMDPWEGWTGAEIVNLVKVNIWSHKFLSLQYI